MLWRICRVFISVLISSKAVLRFDFNKILKLAVLLICVVSYTTKPVEKRVPVNFRDFLKSKEVSVSPHALDHISMEQRKVFKEEELILLLRETPRVVYLQANGRYSAYYRKDEGYRRLIFEIENSIVMVITFMDVKELPKVDL